MSPREGTRRPSLRHRIRKSPLYNALSLPTRLARLLYFAISFRPLVVHDAKLTRGLPGWLLIGVFCRRKRGRLRTPEALTVLLVHNRPNRTLMERSLDYLGVTYTALRVPPDRPWRHSMKIDAIRTYLQSGACKTEYVMFVDSDDALMRDDPAIAIDLLTNAACEMLVSNTRFSRYRGLTDVESWTRSVAPAHLAQRRGAPIHLNSGVYIATTSFLTQFMEDAGNFVTPNDCTSAALRGLDESETRARLPAFPRGSGDDQLIFRLLLQRYFPRIKLDYDSRLARR